MGRAGLIPVTTLQVELSSGEAGKEQVSSGEAGKEQAEKASQKLSSRDVGLVGLR